jgi:hypothetical protein
MNDWMENGQNCIYLTVNYQKFIIRGNLWPDGNACFHFIEWTEKYETKIVVIQPPRHDIIEAQIQGFNN